MSASNSINQWKNEATDGSSESWEQLHLSHVKSSAGMAISPELFEKVMHPFHFPLQVFLEITTNWKNS